MAGPIHVDVQSDVDPARTRLTVRGDLTEHSFPELIDAIERTVRTLGTRLVLDLREIGRADGEALDMLSSHIALLPERVRILARPTPQRSAARPGST